MKLKLDDKGSVVVQDGKPVYVADDGKEVAFDVVGTVATIGRLNSEAKAHRERAEAAEAKNKTFDGITDPAAALKAINTVANLDGKKLIDAGEAERLRAETIKVMDEKYAPVVSERDTLRTQYHNEIVGGAFARSKFIGENVVVPPPYMRAVYEKNFKVEGGKLVAYDANGHTLVSRANPGNAPAFDEAIAMLVDADPYRDNILKGPGSSGGGAQGGGGAAPGAKQVKRATWDAMPATQQAAHVKDGGSIID